MALFKQQSALSGCFLPSGHRINLDFILDDTGDGYLATENGYVVNQIRSAIKARNGGWVEVTQSDYDEAVKKKANPKPVRRGYRNLNAGMFQPQLSPAKVEGADSVAAIVAKPDPITVPTVEQLRVKPRVGKMVPA